MEFIALDRGDGSCELTVHFYNEGVVLEGTVLMLGPPERAPIAAAAYAGDLRRANAHLWPVEPVAPDVIEEEI